MKVQFTDTQTNMVLWSNDALIFRGSTISPRAAPMWRAWDRRSSIRSAASVDRIATDVARSVVTAILEAF